MGKNGKILDIPSTIKYYLSQEKKTESFGINKYADALPFDNFTVLSNEGGLTKGLPIKTDHYAVILCLKGSCEKTVGPFTFDVVPGSLHFVSPRYINSYQNASEDLFLYMVLFKHDFLSGSFIREDILNQLVEVNPEVAPLYNLYEDNYDVIKELFEKIDNECKQGRPFYLQVVKLLLVELLYEMNRACEKCLLNSARHLSRQYYMVYQFKKLVDEHFLILRTVKEYADILNVTPKYLFELVKKETGQTALNVIHNRLYLEAQYLLSSSSYSIKEISDQLGFDTSSHFSRFFKHYAGLNPSSFKNKQ
jgi:AraC-like DNA-binding protein